MSLVLSRAPGRLGGLRVRAAAWAIPLVVVGAVFKLALSWGGRDPESLALVQTVVFVAVAALALAGSLRRTPAAPAIAGVIGALALATIWSMRPEGGVHAVLLWTLCLGVFLLAASAARDPDRARLIVDGVVAAAVWLCLFAAMLVWAGGGVAGRWTSTFYWPNPFAGFLMLALPAALVRLCHARDADEVLARLGVSVLLAVSLVFTQSRGAWMSLAPAAALGAVVVRPPSWSAALRRLALAAALVAVAVALLTRGAPAGSPGVAARAASVADGGDLSVQGRLQFWRGAAGIFRDHPLTGTGPGTFGTVYPRYQVDPLHYTKDPHNVYLQVAAEAGAVGLGALAWLLASIASLWRRALRDTRGTGAYALAAGAGVGIAAFLLHSAVDLDWAYPANPVAAFALAGVLAGLASPAASDRPLSSAGRAALVIGMSAAIVATLGLRLADREYAEGRRLAAAGRWRAAAERYAAAGRLDPLSPLYPAARAVAALRTQPPDPAAAESLIREALARDRANAAHSVELARLATARGALDDAARLLDQAAALDPVNRPEIHRMRADLFLRRGRPDEAARVYRRALHLYLGRDLATGQYFRPVWFGVIDLAVDAARFERGRGGATAAEAILESVLREDRRAVRAAIELADLYAASGRRERARELLQATSRLVPGHAGVRRALDALR